MDDLNFVTPFPTGEESPASAAPATSPASAPSPAAASSWSSAVGPDEADEDFPASVDSLATEQSRIQLAWAKLVWLLVFLAVMLAIYHVVPRIVEQMQYSAARGRLRAEREIAVEELKDAPLAQLSHASQLVSRKVGPSVVHINTRSPDGDMAALQFSTRGMGQRRMHPEGGQGSGIVVDATGYILTNYHVILDVQDITVSLADGRKVPAQVVGYDKETDLALLKIQSDGLLAAEWADSEETQVGSLVWAIGSPYGLEHTITSGILSAKHRGGMAGTPYQDFLQSDAAVNPGNSGGPLVDDQGRLIGVNTAIVGEAYQGISFAVPSNVAQEVYRRLRADGTVRRGGIGVYLEAVTEERARAAGLENAQGVLVNRLMDKLSPAAKAGIEPGDIILRWNDGPVNSPAELSSVVAKSPINSRATVTLMRSGEELTLAITVGQRPQQ